MASNCKWTNNPMNESTYSIVSVKSAYDPDLKSLNESSYFKFYQKYLFYKIRDNQS
jgi:hypothetical protein